MDCYHQTTINHSALLVGYSFLESEPIFIIKNSWGQKWGMRGFY